MLREPGSDTRPLTFVNAVGAVGSLRVTGERIDAIDCRPSPGDTVVDLGGDLLLPGLINAHDHLQLNTLPPLPLQRSYQHVHQWILEIDARRRGDPAFAALVARSRDERFILGGIKNLLAGVTTVAHHDPFHPILREPGFPVRVLAAMGWAHSLYVDGAEAVRASFLATPAGQPWIIHAAEGIDAAALGEFDQLEALGCVRANTLIVHGVALDAERRRRLCEAGAGLIWCPSSNRRLFGTTADIADLAARGRVALGTDSRLSGSRDLLDELRSAGAAMAPSMVTSDAATLLRLADRGALRPGLLADLLVLPAARPLGIARRSDVRLVVSGGAPRYAAAELARQCNSSDCWVGVQVDGCDKSLARSLHSSLVAANADEPGLQLFPNARRVA